MCSSGSGCNCLLSLISDCRGEAALSWSVPKASRESKRLNITKSTCGRNGKQFCSVLTLNAAQANHTGPYSCRYVNESTSRKNKAESTVYVFIHGKISMFYVSDAVALWCFSDPPWSMGKVAFLAPVEQVGQQTESTSMQNLTECVFSCFSYASLPTRPFRAWSVNFMLREGTSWSLHK